MSPLAGLNYKRCRVEELKFFVEKRTGKAPPKSSKKPRLLDALQRLDEDPAVFRFFDLPAEMRNIVYRHVLSLQPGTNGKLCCSPTILRCSKQAREEAQGILYGDNTLRIAIKISHRQSRAPILGAQVREYSFLGVNVLQTAYDGRHIKRISGTYSSWPVHLLRFHGIEINVVVDAQHSTAAADAPEDLQVALNHCLYSICTFLASSSALKTVKVNHTLENGELPGENKLRQTLWPLTRLSRLAQLTLDGVPAAVAQYIRDNGVTAFPSMPIDVLGKATRLCKRVQYLKTLMDDVKQRTHKDRVIARGYDMQEALKCMKYMTEQDDKELKTQIRKLEEMFADPVFVAIKAKADDYLARVKAIRDGAFEEA